MIPSHRLFPLICLCLVFVPLSLFADTASCRPDTSRTYDQQAINQNLTAYMEQVTRQWKIAGSALAVVKDGQIVYAQGFGTKELGKDLPVDANSVFQIGSVSKSFTAALMGMMVDRGLVKWDDTVKKHLPDFDMYDPWVTENLQIRDLFLHRAGLLEQQGTYLPNLGFDRDDICKMLAYLKPASSLRTTYAYNNITFIPAAKIIEKVSGKSWEDNVRECIFQPLDMTASSLNADGFKATCNGNTPHEFVYEDSLVVRPLYGDEQALHWLTVIGPAGGINATVTDMTKWIRFQMGDGSWNGKQLLKPETMSYLHRGQLITSQDDEKITLYGLCWFIEQNHKYRVRFHTGTTWGFTALCAQIDELGLGMMMLCNTEVPAAPRYAVMRRLIDLYTAAPEQDYSTASLVSYLKKAADNYKPAPAPDPQPLQNKQYEGTYRNEILQQQAEIKAIPEGLAITIGPAAWTHPLQHTQGQQFKFRSDGYGFTIEFQTEKEQVTGFTINYGYQEDFGPWIKR